MNQLYWERINSTYELIKVDITSTLYEALHQKEDTTSILYRALYEEETSSSLYKARTRRALYELYEHSNQGHLRARVIYLYICHMFVSRKD